MRDKYRFNDPDYLRKKKVPKGVFRSVFSMGSAVRMITVVVFLMIGGSLLYGQSSGNALFIDNSGRVGIGNSSPEAELDVAGTVRAKAFAGSFAGAGAVPKGVIVMWSGAPDTLPAGWILCDGRQVKGIVTPNLKGRFIVGYDPQDSDYNNNLKPSGGEKRHRLTVDEMPVHQHQGTTNEVSINFNRTSGIGGTHGLAAAANRGTESRRHLHSFVTAAAGGGKDHENRPPYYVLAYIMFVGE